MRTIPRPGSSTRSKPSAPASHGRSTMAPPRPSPTRSSRSSYIERAARRRPRARHHRAPAWPSALAPRAWQRARASSASCVRRPLDAAGLEPPSRRPRPSCAPATRMTATTDLSGTVDRLDDRAADGGRCGSPRRPSRMSASTPGADLGHGPAPTGSTTRGRSRSATMVADSTSAAVAARGRRNFGLQFMRERAELIGARFDVRSRPDGGTVVRLAIPRGPLTGAKENG